MKLKMKGKRPRGMPILRWLDNIDSHLKGKNTSLKEVLETKCFENRKDFRTCYASVSPPCAPCCSVDDPLQSCCLIPTF